ncbi:MAG TPA: DUF3572 domain-containing protein [Bauldia sp.]
MTSERRAKLTHEAAEIVAVEAFSYLASEPELLERFLALSGISPQTLRAASSEPGFLAGVLDFFLTDERLLVAYAERAAIPPTRIAAARQSLGGSND